MEAGGQGLVYETLVVVPSLKAALASQPNPPDGHASGTVTLWTSESSSLREAPKARSREVMLASRAPGTDSINGIARLSRWLYGGESGVYVPMASSSTETGVVACTKKLRASPGPKIA